MRKDMVASRTCEGVAILLSEDNRGDAALSFAAEYRPCRSGGEQVCVRNFNYLSVRISACLLSNMSKAA
jgi:hypothetical protein